MPNQVMMLNSNEQKAEGTLHWQGIGLKQSCLMLGYYLRICKEWCKKSDKHLGQLADG
jgi:hypothetical protein